MKKDRFVHLGPGAALLILVVVVLAMSTLGMLMLLGSRGDRAMSDRAAYVAEQTAQMNEDAEEHYALLCAALRGGEALPELFEADGEIICWQETREQESGVRRVLDCAVDAATLSWRTHMIYTESEMDF